MNAITALRPRQQFLRDLTARWSGQWTPALVRSAYLANGYEVPKKTTAGEDLELLRRIGHLERHDRPGATYYTVRGA